MQSNTRNENVMFGLQIILTAQSRPMSRVERRGHVVRKTQWTMQWECSVRIRVNTSIMFVYGRYYWHIHTNPPFSQTHYMQPCIAFN